MRILVTGHQGYIGSVMTRYLDAQGHDVVGLDTAFFGDCVFGHNDDPTPSIYKDVRDVTADDLRGFDAVVHLAALANDPLGDLNPDWTYDINHGASVHLAQAFAQALTAPRAAVHNQAFNVGPEGENYQVRDLAGIVNELLPQATVEYVGKNPDPRNYRVSFEKIHAALPGFQPVWNARLGARQLLEGYRAVGLTAATFQGPSYTRLLHLKALLASGRLDGSLRWNALVAA